MLKRLKSPFIAWFAVCLLVFSQLAVSAYACAMADGMMGTQASVSMAMPMADMPDCTMKQVSQTPLCKAHCQKEAQSADNSIPTLQPPLLLVLFFTAPYLDPSRSLISALSAMPPAIDSSPPLRIQYQVFRI